MVACGYVWLCVVVCGYVCVVVCGCVCVCVFGRQDRHSVGWVPGALIRWQTAGYARSQQHSPSAQRLLTAVQSVSVHLHMQLVNSPRVCVEAEVKVCQDAHACLYFLV